ncbi:hypothetical protein Cus16_0933 [Curtobacterium sp. ER1/6]|nr:hypothetical protein Cus16_0933 [Curtobacterium sp. ER1/6]
MAPVVGVVCHEDGACSAVPPRLPAAARAATDRSFAGWGAVRSARVY